MTYKWLRRIIGGLSFTSALFIFQACYGTPQDEMMADVLIEGQVTSKVTGKPIQGIKVSINVGSSYELTDADGRFALYTYLEDSTNIRFESLDSVQNTYQLLCDTVVKQTNNKVTLDVKLDSK